MRKSQPRHLHTASLVGAKHWRLSTQSAYHLKCEVHVAEPGMGIGSHSTVSVRNPSPWNRLTHTGFSRHMTRRVRSSATHAKGQSADNAVPGSSSGNYQQTLQHNKSSTEMRNAISASDKHLCTASSVYLQYKYDLASAFHRAAILAPATSSPWVVGVTWTHTPAWPVSEEDFGGCRRVLGGSRDLRRPPRRQRRRISPVFALNL